METIKVTNRDIMAALDAITTLRGEKPPVKIAFALQRNFRQVETAAMDVENIREGLVAKYGTTLKDGQFGVDRTDAKTFRKFNEELRDLYRQEVEIMPYVLKLSVLRKAKMKWTLGQVMSLFFMLEDDLGEEDLFDEEANDED